MSSRATTGAVLFVIAVGAIGAYSAYRAERRSDEPVTAAAPKPAGDAKTAVTAPEAGGAPAATSASGGETSSGSASGPTAETADASQPATNEAASQLGAEKPAPSVATTSGRTTASSEASAPAGQASGATSQAGSNVQNRTTSASSVTPTKSDTTSAAGQDDATADTETRTVESIELETPTYDVVRVEPSGDAVIAGRASPGATVELRANGTAIASATTNTAGEWVIVLDKPLPPGDYDLALHSSHPNGKAPATSSDRLAVSIPQNGTETPLVALSRADGPVEVLQKPDEQTAIASASKAPATTEVASNAAASGSSGTSAAETTTAAAPTGPASSQGSAASDTADAEAAGGKMAASSDASEGGDTVIANLVVREETMTVPREPSEATVAQDSTPAAKTGAADAPAAAETAASSENVSDNALTGTGGNAEIAYARDAAQKDTLQAPKVPVTIDSAEVSKENQFVVQGTSEPGATIWLYLNQDFVGAVRADGDGHWTFQTAMDITPGTYSIRADQVRNMEGAVTARAEVPFGYRTDEAAAPAPEMGSRDAPASDGPQLEVLDSNEDGVRVLVRRGDALWTIARNFYGDGFRYTTIYQANDRQIRDPNLIYPGQVFVLPGLTEEQVRAAQGG
ncbi:LysM peptidoglycan-binding domain-containing protein [Amorphus sp. 3PC139-8]|uniref:LysM peptidoglycan-binding domain-containing protein n=1 Tax=Amorphus sp. 3PC139-8 TaxID=2735676 RepID=UPI00345CB1F5